MAEEPADVAVPEAEEAGEDDGARAGQLVGARAVERQRRPVVGQAADAAPRSMLEFTASGPGDHSFSLKCEDKQLAAGAIVAGLGVLVIIKLDGNQLFQAVKFGTAAATVVSIANLWKTYKENTERAIRDALEGTPTNGAHAPDPEIEEIHPGSLIVKLRCRTEESLIQFVLDYDSGKVKQRLEKELSKIGFTAELTVTIENRKELEAQSKNPRFFRVLQGSSSFLGNCVSSGNLTMGTLQKAVHEFGVFSSRVKSIYDETVTCFKEIKQMLPLNKSEGDKDVLSTAALSEVQRALRKNPSVIFIGDRNCGKSSLLNEVLGGSYLPVHENPCTSRIVRIVFAEEMYAELITRDGRVIETKSGFKKKIPREFAVMSDADKEGEKLQCTVKVGLNHELLRSGIELIDSPGRNENDELDSVLDKFLGDGTVPLIVYIIDGGTGLKQTDLKTINVLQEKFPQVSFMFVCNKVDTTSGASDYDRDSDDEDKDEVDAKELSVFEKLKAAKIIPPEALLGSYPYFHAVSAKETKKARKDGKCNQAVEMFQRFERCLKEKLEAAIKQDTKRAVDKLLVLQESFVTGVNIVHDKQKEETRSIRLQHIPDIFEEIWNAEAALKNTLATLAANQQGMQLLIENKLRSLERNFMRKAELYKIPSEGNIREDIEDSTMQVGSPEVAFEILFSVDELNLSFARFVEDMKETILSETFNALKDPLLQTMNNPIANASKTIMSLSEKLQHPAVSQIFQESYQIGFKENQDQSNQLLLVVLDGLFESIGNIVTVAFRREISGPLSEVLSFGSGRGRIGQDIKDKENRREVVKVLLSRIDSRHVSEALIKECREVFESMHDTFSKALLNLLDFVDVLSKDVTSTQLKELRDVHTPKVRALAIKGLALQFLMKKGPAELGDPVPCTHPKQIYECLSPCWSHDDMPSVVKVVEKSKVDDEVWKRTSVDLINTWDIFGRYGKVHPNLLRIHGWLMPHDDVLHIVMERAQTDLLTALRRRMSLEKRLKVAADVAQGLKAMHKVGYVYQDLKPETVLLMADGTAKINMAIPERPLEETRLGCPFHISPEMYRNYNTGITHCSYDIYAFGMLLWVLCEGTGETRPQAFSPYLTNAAMRNAVEDGVVPERPPEATDACWDLMMKCWKVPESLKIDEVLELVNKMKLT